MAQNFIACDREQELLLPPSLREWLPADHLAWFVLDAVAEMDLAAFYGSYREDGWGRAAHDPAMMVALFVYAYAIGERPRGASSGAVETTSRFGSSPPTTCPITPPSRDSGCDTSRRSPTCSGRCWRFARAAAW
jgi:hypothetical protein